MTSKNTAVMFASSDTFTFALFVSVASFLKHSPQLAAQSDIYIYAYQWSQKTKGIFAKEFPVTIVDYDVPSFVPHSTQVMKYTPALFARFEGFSLLNKYQHVFCLDSDILVQKELSHLLNCQKPLAITIDGLSLGSNFFRPIEGYDFSKPCYNAGFIVLNNTLPGKKIHHWLYQMLAKYADICYLGDQGLINLALQQFDISIELLPQLYNLPASRKTSLLKQAYIIHATGPRKFWCYYYYDEWYNLYARWHALTGRTQTWRTNTPAWDKFLARHHLNKYVFFQLAPDGFKYPGKFLRFSLKRWLRSCY